VATAEALPAPDRFPPWREFASAPLVPVAIAATLGILIDRYATGSVIAGLSLAFLAVLAWKFTRHRHAVALLWLAVAGLGLAHHHAHSHEFPADDVGQYIDTEKSFASVRGTLLEDPITRHRNLADPLAPERRHDLDVSVLDVSEIETAGGTWIPASGRVRLWVEHPTEGEPAPPMMGLHAGDTVQAVGQWRRPRPPGNPGERDANDTLRNQRLRGELRIGGTTAGITRWESAPWGYARILSATRRHGTATLNDALPAGEANIARALLLGDGSALDRAEWDAFLRTGVVHVLAISGQHLVLLAAFVWLALGAFGVPRRRAAWVVAAIIVEIMHIMGIHADPHGTTIYLKNGPVGIAEACSGIRSLQASLMISLAVGELFFLRLGRRFLLVLLCASVATLLKCGLEVLKTPLCGIAPKPTED